MRPKDVIKARQRAAPPGDADGGASGRRRVMPLIRLPQPGSQEGGPGRRAPSTPGCRRRQRALSHRRFHTSRHGDAHLSLDVT